MKNKIMLPLLLPGRSRTQPAVMIVLVMKIMKYALFSKPKSGG
jgi:hypothetical protein